jgi:hypothetical protein
MEFIRGIPGLDFIKIDLHRVRVAAIENGVGHDVIFPSSTFACHGAIAGFRI